MSTSFFDLPPELISVVYSFLNVPALGCWRIANKQAFQDVERLMLLRLKDVCCFVFQDHSPVWFGSAWYQFIMNTYTCVQCERVQSVFHFHHHLCVDYEEAQNEQLCVDCFMRSEITRICTACGTFERHDVNGVCEHCHQFWCEGCSDDVLGMCFECTGLFCDSCRLDDTCINC